MLTKKEVADYLNVSVPTIDRYMKIGMPHVKLATGTVRFEQDKVKDWIEYQRKG